MKLRRSVVTRAPFRGRSRALHLGLLAGSAVFAWGFQSAVTTLNWTNLAGGPASTSTNWNPAQVPSASDDLVFNIGGNYTTTYNSSVPSSRTQTYRSGTVTISGSSPHTTSNGITVGSLAGDVATATLTTGTLNSNGAVVVGNAVGSTGTLNVNDDDADLMLATSSGDLTVGSSGNGNLNVTGGGFVFVSDRFTAGTNTSSTVNVNVSGFSVAPLATSTLTLSGIIGTHAIGANGDVNMAVTNGGQVDFVGSVNVAQGATSSSTLSIAGTGLVRSSLETVGNLNIGRNQTAGAAGGIGTVNVDDNGILDVGGVLKVGGDPDGGTATLHLSTGAQVTTTSLEIGAGGTLDFVGGTLDVVGGTLTETNPADEFALGGTGSPVFTMRGGAVGTLAAVGGNRAVTVGKGVGNAADFFIREGSALNISPGDIVLGDTQDSDGSLTLSTSSLSLPIAALITVGQSGTGFFHVDQSSVVQGGQVFVAQNSGSSGTVVIERIASAHFSSVSVGGSNVAPGGTGSFVVNAQGVCTVTDTGLGMRVWAPGSLRVLGSTLSTVGSIDVIGTAVLEDQPTMATINTPRFTLSGGTLSGTGAIRGEVHVNNVSSSITAQNGALTLGTLASNRGFENGGLLSVGAEQVTLLDQTTAPVNNATISGGALVVPNGMTIANGTTLSGFGSVDADVTNSGTIAGLGAGLTFKGIVFGTGQGFGGSTTRFVQGGGFAGSGTITAPIVGDASSSFTATGPLIMGGATTSTGVDIDGTLAVGSFDVTLITGNNVRVGRLTTLDGGTLSVGSRQFLLQDGDTLRGMGSVSALVRIEGTSVVEATGPLSLGIDRAGGFNSTGGRLDVSNHPVVLLNQSALVLPALTTMAGGSVTGLNTLLLDTLGGTPHRLTGFGTVVSPVDFLNNGAVEPGSPIGTLTFDTVYRNEPQGTLSIQIQSSADLEEILWDTIEVTGDAFLGGTLAVASTPVPFAAGDSLRILSCGERVGTFDNVVFSPSVLGNILDVVYTHNGVYLVANATTSIDPDLPGSPEAVPAAFNMRIVGANPFPAGSGTAIEYDVPSGGSPVSIAVYDAIGRQVAELTRGPQTAGRHAIEWRGHDLERLPSGVYLVRMNAARFHDTQRLVMIR